MAAVATETRKFPELRSVRSTGTVVLSGSYATGGDPLAIPKPYTTKEPYNVSFTSKNGNNFGWDPVAKTMKAFSAVGTELAAGAYAAGYTGDVITYMAEFPKLG
jgi:hypothetical protein